MTPDQIRTLRQQLGLSQAEFAAALQEIDPILKTDLNAVSRYERGVRTPNPHVTAALARLWLMTGYPVTATMHDGASVPGMLTTDSSASSYGQPVVIIDGVAHGAGDVDAIRMDNAPDSIVSTAIAAGFVVR